MFKNKMRSLKGLECIQHVQRIWGTIAIKSWPKNFFYLKWNNGIYNLSYFDFRSTCLVALELNCEILRLPCTSYANFSIIKQDYALEGSVIKTLYFVSENQCKSGCVMNPRCKSYNKEVDGDQRCELNDKTPEDKKDAATIVKRPGWIFGSTDFKFHLVRNKLLSYLWNYFKKLTSWILLRIFHLLSNCPFWKKVVKFQMPWNSPKFRQILNISLEDVLQLLQNIIQTNWLIPINSVEDLSEKRFFST